MKNYKTARVRKVEWNKLRITKLLLKLTVLEYKTILNTLINRKYQVKLKNSIKNAKNKGIKYLNGHESSK